MRAGIMENINIYMNCVCVVVAAKNNKKKKVK